MKRKRFINIVFILLEYVGWNYYHWMPTFLRKIIQPNYKHILNFVILAAEETEGKLILDAGAGPCPYKKLFNKSIYESTDYNNHNNIHTFQSSLEEIPIEDARYDAILCSEVLEHVKSPQKAVAEFNRILKPTGKLYITVPLQARFHSAPYHYFNFTESGLRLILEEEGFQNIKIKPNGGMFHFIANNINVLPQELFLQQLRRKKIFLSLLILPVVLLVHVASVFLNPILYVLDCVDKDMYITTGYTCSCNKK